MKTHVQAGRAFRVLAEFTGFDRATEAKAYMRTHPHTKVLCDEGGTTYIVFEADKGTPTEKADDGWNQGWTSLFAGGIRYPTKQPPTEGT